MAIEQLLVTHTTRFGRRYCAFTGSDGEMRAAAKRQVRLLAVVMLLGFVPLLATVIAGLARERGNAEVPIWFILTTIAVALPLVLSILQMVAQSYVRINFSSTDPLPMVCTIINTQHGGLSPPRLFELQIPNSDVEVRLRVPENWKSSAEIAGQTVVKAQPRARPRGFVLRMPPLHVDFEDHAGHKATLDGSHGKRRRYRLVYDEEFDFQWLLLVVVATLLLR